MTPLPRRPRLAVTQLEDRDTPAFLPGAELVVASDAGGPPVVRRIDPGSQTVTSEFLAFDGGFYGGVRTAVGDVTGDRVADLVVAAGPGGGPAVKVYDGRTGGVVSSFFPFPADFTGGTYVAVGDTDGDGVGEVIAGAGAGGGPIVSVRDGRTGAEKLSFLAYSPAYLGGVRVAAGDLNNDGRAEVVTVPGFTGGPNVRTFDLSAGRGTQTASFMAYAPNFTAGLTVAVGDVDGDGRGDIVTGAGPSGGPHVAVFDAVGNQKGSFFAYDSAVRSGVRVAVAELTGDGVGEIVTGPGTLGGPNVKAFDLRDTGRPLTSLFGLSEEQLTGVWVAASPTPLNVPDTPASEVFAAYDRLKTFQQANRPVVPTAAPAGVPAGFQTPVYPFGYGGFYDPFWIGPGFWDATGLYVGLGAFYGAGFFGSPVFAQDVFYDPVFSPDFGYGFDPGYYYDGGYFVDDGVFGPAVAPGYYDPSGYFVDPGYYDPAGYEIDYGFYDDGWYYDDSYYGGFYDYGGFDDFGGYYDFGGFDGGWF